MEASEIISSIFSHPFVLLLLGALIGRLYFLDELIADKTIAYKIEIIRKLVDIKNTILEIEFFHDRIVNTFSKINESNGLIATDKGVIFDEIMKVSNIVNEKLPLKKKYFDTEMNFYFKGDNCVITAYEKYSHELKSFSDFMVHQFPTEKDLFKKRLADYDIFKNSLYESESQLIDAIKRSKHLFKAMS